MLIIKENKVMIYLKIENNSGKFLKDGNYLTVDKMTRDDLWHIANAVMNDEKFEMEQYDESRIGNKAHQIIYKNVFELLVSLQSRKEQFRSECEAMYKEAYDKYKQ